MKTKIRRNDPKFKTYRLKVGAVHSNLTVVEEIKNRNGRYSYRLRCACGKLFMASPCSVLNKTYTSCGCMKTHRCKEMGKSLRKDLTGKKIGILTVIGLEKGDGRKGATWWRVKCKCGNEKIVRAGNLQSKSVQSCGCLVARRGEKSPNWKGGSLNDQGYKTVVIWEGNRRTHKREHRQIMENMLGRKLRNNENVHHRNGIKNDNRPENLELWVKTQPCGQRVTDLIEFCRKFLEVYEDEFRSV